MSLILALALAAATADQSPVTDSAPEQVALDHATEDAACAWLAMVDASDWSASFAAAGKQFREQNTVAGWEAASQAARVSLGAVMEREAVGYQSVNAPPRGYRVVPFRSDFANRKGATESVTLEHEDDGGWRGVGTSLDEADAGAPSRRARAPSIHVLPAIDAHGGSGDEGAIIGGEEGDAACDLVCVAEPTDGDLGHDLA